MGAPNRKEVEDAAFSAVQAYGGADLVDRRAVVAQFMDRGVSRATLYRWVASGINSGKTGQVVAKKVKKAATRRGKASQKATAKRKVRTRVGKRIKRATESGRPVKEVVGEMMLEKMPSITTVDDVAGSGTIRVIDHLNQCIETARLVMHHAKGEDGKPRLTKLLLAASEHLRRCLETANRIAEKINELQKVERFHQAMIAEINKESPACARRILEHLDLMAQDWSG